MAVVAWPSALPSARRGGEPYLRNMRSGGGRTARGRQQLVFADAGFWEVPLELYLRTPEQRREYRALHAQLVQGDEVDVHLCEFNGPPGFYSADAAVTLGAEVASRSTSLTLSVTGLEVARGMWLNIGVGLYLVTAVTAGASNDINPLSGDGPWNDNDLWEDGSGATTSVTVSILPPTRNISPLASGTAVSINNMRFRAILDDPASGRPDIELGKRGSVSLILQESI